MVAAIRQQVTVVADGLLEVRSPELRAGARAEVIVLVDQSPVSGAAADDRQAAWDRLRRHAGAVDSGDPRGSDSEQIEADLAREHGGNDGTPA